MSVDPNNRYTGMQAGLYESAASQWNLNARDYVVGSFEAHNNHPGYAHLFEGFDTKNMIALDFGCGPGRNLVKYANDFKQLDGCDIAQENLRKAIVWCEHNSVVSPALFKVNGISLDTVPDEAYDLVFSTITFQHIAVHEIRYAIMEDMLRVLRPGGWISIQMGYGPVKHDAVDYEANYYDAGTTNGNMDVRVISPDQLEDDLKKMGFQNFGSVVDEVGPGNNHQAWIYFRAQK